MCKKHTCISAITFFLDFFLGARRCCPEADFMSSKSSSQLSWNKVKKVEARKL